LAHRRFVLLLFIAGSAYLPGSAILFSQNHDDNHLYFDPGKRFSVRFSGIYISSTELQNNITSSNPIERDASTDMSGGFGYAGELTFDPRFGNSGIRFFVSSEYFTHKEENLYLRYYEDTLFFTVRFEEQFYFLPVEGGIKWNLPVSTSNFRIYIGGGGGLYFGNRKRTAAGLVSTTDKVKPGFSLNVFSGFDYYIARNLSAAFEIKFRDAYFEAQSRFGSGRFPVFGLPNPFTSRISVNGTALSLGLKYNF
jgi:hypothetical protein